MTLDQMRYFMEVAYCRSFSQAAQNLFISQPNLTKYIASMEKELGVKLFDRTTRRVDLTEAGERLLLKAQTSIMPFLQNLNDLKSELGSTRPNIHIGVARDETLPEKLLELFRRRQLAPEGSRILLTQDNHQHLSEGLRQQYDLIISSDRHICSQAGVSFVSMRPFRMILAVSKQHPLADKPDLSPPDFRNELIYFALPQGTTMTPSTANPIYYRIGGVVNIKLLPSPSDALLNADLCGGAAIVPDLTDASRFPNIHYIPFNDRMDQNPTFQRVFWSQGETRPHIMALLDELIALFGPIENG